MNERIEELKRQIAHLEEQERLANAVKASAEVYEAEPTQSNYRKHIAAEEALTAHRAKTRGKLRIVGDVTVSEVSE